MKRVCIRLLLLITVYQYGHCYRSSEVEENSEKLSTLEKRVSVLTNELRALKEVNVLKGEPISQPDPDLLPLEASRTMLPGGKVRFILKYKAKPAISGQVRVFWIDTDNYEPVEESYSNEIPRLPPDVYQSSIETEASNTNEVSVSIGTIDFWYRLNIKNALEGNAMQLITSLPKGEVTPAHDLVYQLGTNATIQLTRPVEEQSLDNPGFERASNMDLHFFINPPGSDDILEKYGDDKVLDNFFKLGDEKIFFDKKEVSIVFNTSVVAYSGLLQIMLGQTYRNNLVNRIEKNFLLTLHPSNQSEAFREDLLTFRHQHWLETNANGDHVEHCRPDELCRIYCQVFGNSPNEVVMLKTVNGVPETIIPQSHEEGDYFSYAMDTFHMTSDPNPINYTCVGIDAGGQRVANTFMVYLRDPPTFVDNQTTIEASEEGDVNVTCTATGSPLPQMNIRFVLPRTTEPAHGDDDFEILYQTNDTISVSKVVNVADFGPDMLYSLSYSMFATCEASNTGGENIQYMSLADEEVLVSY